MSSINQSALKKHALACSKAVRAGKFTRVGSDYIQEVEAEVEALIRDLRNQRFPIHTHDALPSEENFVTGALLEKVKEALNKAISRIIQQRVQRQPSVGQTLGRTI